MKNIKYFVYLHIILALFSVSAVFSKLASAQRPPSFKIGDYTQAADFTAFMQALSPKWLMYYAGILIIMFIYAVAWQQIIKRMPIVTAYANKAVMVIWGIIWGLLIFDEKITFTRIAGALIIITGVYLVVTGDEDDAEKEKTAVIDKTNGSDLNCNDTEEEAGA
ncbi:MAG: DMT family transporter [Lachnospiraceae bacterium]|nr:DMT family transporter [Lachnospiraceae bacterium]